MSTTGDLTLLGTSLWTGGQISGTDNIVVGACATLTVSSPGAGGVLARSVVNSGTLIWNQPSLLLSGGVSITNQAAGVFEIQANMPISGAAPRCSTTPACCARPARSARSR